MWSSVRPGGVAAGQLQKGSSQCSLTHLSFEFSKGGPHSCYGSHWVGAPDAAAYKVSIPGSTPPSQTSRGTHCMKQSLGASPSSTLVRVNVFSTSQWMCKQLCPSMAPYLFGCCGLQVPKICSVRWGPERQARARGLSETS